MNCPNCGHPVEEGAAFCGYCGSPLPTAETLRADISPVKEPTPATFVSPPVGESPLPLPSSSGPAKASLWLGILGIVLVILGIVVPIVGVLQNETLREFSFEQPVTEGDINRLTQDPAFQEMIQEFSPLGFGAMALCGLGELGALVGLILGIVGLSQEESRPTRSGRAHSIIGIVLSALPLLCCVALGIFYLVGLGQAVGGATP